jgi:hypothetical protein
LLINLKVSLKPFSKLSEHAEGILVKCSARDHGRLAVWVDTRASRKFYALLHDRKYQQCKAEEYYVLTENFGGW